MRQIYVDSNMSFLFALIRAHIKPIFQSIAAKVGSEPCCDWVRNIAEVFLKSCFHGTISLNCRELHWPCLQRLLMWTKRYCNLNLTITVLFQYLVFRLVEMVLDILLRWYTMALNMEICRYEINISGL